MTKYRIKNGSLACPLAEFIYNFSEIAHFKENKTFTYQMSNKTNLAIYTLKKETQLVGKTIFDVKREVMDDKWSDAFVQEIHRADTWVAHQGKSLQLKRQAFLNQSGYAGIYTITKIPVFDTEKRVVGILTLGTDTINTASISAIRNLYGELYPDKVEANIWFMKYINFTVGIDAKFSPREMDCLLNLLKYRNNKRASYFLGIMPKTFHNHLDKIKQRVAGRYTIQGLVEELAEKINRI